jgi:hypothetical protein
MVAPSGFHQSYSCLGHRCPRDSASITLYKLTITRLTNKSPYLVKNMNFLSRRPANRYTCTSMACVTVIRGKGTNNGVDPPVATPTPKWSHAKLKLA